MITLTKEVTFDAAHQLLNHDGLCKNIHGHTYKLQVTLTGLTQDRFRSLGEGIKGIELNPKEGMIMDFGDLKKIIKEEIDMRFDHAFIAKGDEPILPALRALDYKIAEIGVRTTCEQMTPYIYHLLSNALVLRGFTGISVESVKLWETPTSYAIYRP